MTPEHDLEKRLSAVEAEAAAIRAEIAKMPDGGRWVPKDGEEYWTIDDDGVTNSWPWAGHNIDDRRFYFFNVFEDKESAEREARRTRTRRHLESLADAKLDERTNLWRITYEHSDRQFSAKNAYTSNNGEPIFSTQAKALAAIKEVAEDNLRELFEV